jgi:uncharacterized protein
VGNLRKHGVSFENAMTIFNDPFVLTTFDPDHSNTEDRWVSIGLASTAQLLLSVHTHVEIDAENVTIRIISARKPTERETRQYAEGT